MNVKHKAATAVTMVTLLGIAGTTQAAFQGRDATGAASATCTSTGSGKCTYFYDTTLDITILNNWNIGKGTWSASAALGSAQALAASAGFAASGLEGWVLPTHDVYAAPGALNQFESIGSSAGGNFAGLSGQFDGVQLDGYWSGTLVASNPLRAWPYYPIFNSGLSFVIYHEFPLFAVAVRPGDIAAAIPEPQTYALMLLGVGAVLVAQRRRAS
jgi:hypothetical protein